MSDRVRSALAIALSVTNTKWTDGAIQFVLGELDAEDEGAVLEAIRLAVRECEYRLTLADIVKRIVRPNRSTAITHEYERVPMPPHIRARINAFIAKGRNN